MQDLKELMHLVKIHAREYSEIIDVGSVINFLDHISQMGDDCDECAEAMKAYTAGEVTKNV